MNDNLKEKLTVCIEKGGQRDQAEAFANRYSVTIEEEPGEELTLLFEQKWNIINRIWTYLSGRF